MSDNPMYWPGHQRPAWHQQPPSAQAVNSMGHYATHPGNMLGTPMGTGMPGDPTLQMQSSIPGRHQPHQSSLSQHQSTLAPPGAQSTLYPSMMPAPGAPTSARPTTQLTSNSHLSSATTQGIPPHPSIQQSPHPQSHYSHQYSSLASPYWNPPPPMNSQSNLGPSQAPVASQGAASQGTSGPPPTQPDGTNSYHSASSASPLTMPNESRGSLSTNPPTATMQQQQQQTAPSFHSPKDIQSSADHMMSYDRQRSSIAQQQQHPSAMMSQNVAANSTSSQNLSPTQSQISMQGRLQSQSQLDSMRSMSQQPNAAPPPPNWSSSYYAQPNQSPYSSVMNPYMPYASSSAVPNHNSTVAPPPTRPPSLNQKPAANGSDRARAAYPPHASLYGQQPPPTGSTNGSYYGYDPYYNQVASGQAPPDPYLSHQNSAGAPQHWSLPPSNQMISNSSATVPGSLQPALRPPQTGSTNSAVVHPQSPSASSTLPTLSTRPPPPPSQTPDRSPAPQHPTSYPSPNQQGSSSKSATNSLAQLEQMVMPGSGGQSTTTTLKSPTHRSSTSSPSANTQQQQQLQYSYNSSGQGTYFSTTGSGAASAGQASYYPQYDSSGPDLQKPSWSEQSMNPIGAPSGSVMMEAGSSYNQPSGYEGSASYGDYTSLSTPSNNNNSQPRFSTPGDTTEAHSSSDKVDPYAIDSQTFDDYDDQATASKMKKTRGKKGGDDKVKRERKPRAPRAPKGAAAAAAAAATPVTPTASHQPQSPSASASLQALQVKSATGIVTQELSPGASIINSNSNSFPSPNQQGSSLKSVPEASSIQNEPQVKPTSKATSGSLTSKSPATHRLSTESPSATNQSQPMQYSYSSSGQPSYYSAGPDVSSTPTNQTSNYYTTYEPSTEIAKNPWPTEQQSNQSQLNQPTSAGTVMEVSDQASFSQSNFENSSSYNNEYTALSVPSASSARPSYPAQSDVAEVGTTPAETTESQNLEEVGQQQSATKSKKSRAKKGGEEKAKKERKPRTAKGALNKSAQATSPASATVQLAQDTTSTTSYPSPGHGFSFTTKSVGEGSNTEILPNSGSGKTTPSKSPAHRLSTESPNLGPSTQTQYQYSGSTPATYGYSAQPGNYYPQYDPNVVELQKPNWSDPSSTVHMMPGVSGPVLAEGSQSSYGPPGSSYVGEYTSLTAPGNSNSSQPRFPTPGENTETMPYDAAETSSHQESQAVDESLSENPIVPAKPKKSRAKKSSEEKVKKERKPRAAKAPQPAPSQPQPAAAIETATPTTPQPSNDDSVEPPSKVEVTPTTEPTKPKRIRIRDSSSKGKKKLPKFALKFAKTKKRKRLGSSDNDQSDLDKTPPPSPDEVESGVQKRRSARNTKKLKYNDDIELGFSDSDDESQVLPRSKKTTTSTPAQNDAGDSTITETVVADEPTVFAAPVEDTMVVEKIMATRTGQRELEPEPGEVLPPDGTHIEVEEFYVKYKNLSYLHCDWRTLEELEKGDRRVLQKVKRYKQKKDSSNLFSFMDEEPFDPQYCEVDRILAVNEVEEMVPDDSEEEEAKKDSLEAPAQISADIEAAEVKEVAADEEKPTEDAVVPASDEKGELEQAKVDSESENVEKSMQEEEKAVAVEASEVHKEEVKLAEKDEAAIKSTSEIDKTDSEKANIEADSRPEEQVDMKPNESDLKPQEETDDKSKAESVIEEVKPEAKVEISSDANAEIKPESEAELAQVEQKPRKMKKKISRHYLVKWRGLSYEDSTWELEDDLDPEKIKYFMKFKDPPPKSKWKAVKRPKPEEWVRKEVSPVYKNNNTLREYQLEGINWLSFCWHQGRNCILADEMGLGKTIQSIAFVNEIYQYGINGPFLIIVPLSTVGNWAREFETWTDLNVITYHGSSTSREMLKEYEMFYRNDQGNRIMSYYKFQVMITTFEIILSDCLDLREIPWRCCIIDEAHRLKNRNCKLLEGLRLLNMEHRVLLTGTPLQNNVEELFSLLNFLEPSQFSSTEQFLQEFGDLKTEAQVDKLKLILKPMMLRRLKEDVEKTLAPKEETIVEVELTNIQKKYYRAILEKNFSFLSKGSSNNNMPNLMNTMMELRKCCIHPYLINGAEEQIMYEARQTKLAGGEPMSSYQALVNSSGKLVLIDKLLPRLRADGHRVLIFSQMVRCLDILEDYVTHKHYPFERIDGRVRGSDRQQAIDRFSKPGSDRFVFLLCTRAGGLGINLTAADTVIIFDSDWNPQNDLQAQARCHRIGQSKAVKIYRLICRNTYEREMFDKASLKLGLDKAVLQSMNTQKGGAGGLDGQLTKKEIEELLRKGAYGALMDDDNAGDKFCEEDIDQILQRRTQVITIDNSEAKGSTFSKATFSSSNNREDIELDDPNFWEKWAKKANIESDDMRSKDELIQLAPRRRTQTKRYGADGNLIDISDLDSSEEDEETISMRTRGSRSGRQTKMMTPQSTSKRSKRMRFLEFEDDEFLASLDNDYWSKGDCLKVEKGLLTFGWGRWDKIIASNRYKRELTVEDCEGMCRVILLYCLNSYKGDEKIKSSAWELITPVEEANKSQSDLESCPLTRGRKPKSASILGKKTIAEEIADAKWPKEAKNDPLLALPDDQYRRHLQRNCNRLLIRVKLLHYLKNDILKGYTDKILSDCNVSEVDIPPVPVDGDLPAPWWDDEADKSLLVGIFKHGHDKFNLMRQDPNLCFLQKCGPPDKDELLAEMSFADRSVEDLDDENREQGPNIKEAVKIIKGLSKESLTFKDSEAGECLNQLVDNVVVDLSASPSSSKDSADDVDENKNRIVKYSESDNNKTEDSCENGVNETSNQATKMDIDDEGSLTNEIFTESTTAPKGIEMTNTEKGEFLEFPSANDLNQRFRRLITAYQRNSKKLEIKLAQKARDELKKERTSKFEAAKNEREERKRSQAQKWSRREEADFFRAISSFGVEYDDKQQKHDWNKFRAIGKLEKKLDETMEEYYRAFVIMCKKVTSRPLTADEEKCDVSVDTITEERASRCLTRIEFLNKIRGQIITHPELDERLKQCLPQSDLPDWWENGKHDKDLLFAAAKHGLTRLDYNLAHDPTLSFDSFIRQKAEHILSQPPASILIPLEQLQELLEKNGIEYLKDLDLEDDSEDIKSVLNSIIDTLETEESSADTSYKSFVELVDGPHSKTCNDESSEKSLLASSNSLKTTPVKATRSSTGLSNSSSRTLPNILARKGANTIVKSAEASSLNPNSVRLTSSAHATRGDDRRVVEITPILPDKIPEELVKSFEAGELSLTLQSESALLQLDDRAPIVLMGAVNPVAAKIRWPKDKAIQTRLENLVYLVEKNEWPSPPKPTVPTITLPNHLTTSAGPTAPLTVTTSSPAKNDNKAEASLGSPKSDISNKSSHTSKQDLKERSNELSTTGRGRRGRGRKPRQSENELSSNQELELPREDRQAAAKLRNLLSQGPSSTKGMGSSSGEKLTAKFGGNKQGAGLSSLLASFKQQRGESGPGGRACDDKNLLDLNSPGTANLLPQILANMKPEFRDLLSNQDAANMLLNSLSGMTGTGTNLRSSSSSAQLSIDNLLNVTRPTKGGPPPAHQRSDNPPSAHSIGSSSTRELRRNSQSARENSPPSINLRSTRGKGGLSNLETGAQQKPVEMAHGKAQSSKKRGRPTSSTSESPPNASGADILDLSSLPMGSGDKAPSSKSESRPRRHRDQNEDWSASTSSSRHSGTTSSKANLRASTKQASSHETEQQQPSDKGVRTTRASKRIGSRIDALALNLQAKKLNRGDSPTSDLSPSLPKDRDIPMAAHGSGSKSGAESKSYNSKAPPAAHSGSHKSSSSNSHIEQRRDKTNPTTTTSSSTPTSTSTPTSSRQDPLAQFMSNPTSLLAGLNPSALTGAGDIMNQLLRKAGTNDIVKNLLNEFMKNPSLALDPNILATLTASLPVPNTQSLPGFTLPTQTPTTLSSGPRKAAPSSLLNDFKLPTSGSGSTSGSASGSSTSLMKRSRQESSSSSSRHSNTNVAPLPTESRRSSSSTSDRHERRSSSSSSSTSDRRSSYQDRPEKHSKHEKRSSNSNHQEPLSDASSRRSSSSLLAQQAPTTSVQTTQPQVSAAPNVSQPSLPNAATLNLANQFGGLNSLGGLLNFPGMNELVKQMTNFNLPTVSSSAPTSMPGNSASRRSRPSTGASTSTSTVTSQQQAANAALANSLMNFASQPSATTNPFGNYANPLANPFLNFGLGNLGMNPLGMGLFPNLYATPPGFPTTDQQQQQQQQQQTQQSNQTGGSSDGSSKDKKMRYPKR